MNIRIIKDFDFHSYSFQQFMQFSQRLKGRQLELIQINHVLLKQTCRV